MVVVDRIGRRKLVVGGNLAMCLTYVISTILLAQFPPEVHNTGAHWGFIIMTWVYNFCFASMGSLCMVTFHLRSRNPTPQLHISLLTSAQPG